MTDAELLEALQSARDNLNAVIARLTNPEHVVDIEHDASNPEAIDVVTVDADLTADGWCPVTVAKALDDGNYLWVVTLNEWRGSPDHNSNPNQ